ncbi:MAG: IS1182 family transposase [Elusimicrobia bacterium]|nr:IS1182 family transposase [Elusimicrobiota bacterium]
MAYRYGDRHQMNLFPQSIEDYVREDDPVRAYDAFVESLELGELGIIVDENQVGNPEYEPKAMIKLLVYGYSYGIRSSRKLERATYHNVSFIWLMGGLKPDHKTIARFRTDNKRALKNILKQCARLCIKLGLIEGNTLFVDGSKIRANAAIDNTWTQEKCEKHLKSIDEHIESILKECDVIDEKEQNSDSLVKLKEELKDKEALKSKVQNIMKELKSQELQSMNSTDPECIKVKGRQGIHSGYSGQIVVDEKHGLIVNSDVVNEHNDREQFANQIEQAHETLEHKCKNACADDGYANTDELKKIADKNVNVIVPSQEQTSQQNSEPFAKEQFTYDSQTDSYICPQGHKLPYSHLDKEKNMNVYSISDRNLCRNCVHFGICTTSNKGRRIKRLANEETKKILEQNFTKEQSQTIFRLRKQKVELPFGHIKRNLGVTAFLLRGLDGVKAEMSLFSSCFNMSRMISIIGVQALVAKLMS